MIGDEFHPAAVAEHAEIGALLGEVGEEDRATRNRSAVAAGIDDKIAHPGLRAGSAQRAIERDVAGLFQDGLEAELVGEGKGGELDHNSGRLAGIGDGLRHALDRGGSGQARHDDRRVTCDLFHAIGDDDLGRRKLGALGGVGIEADHAPPAIDKVAGDRPAHDAKPDDSNSLVHAVRSLPVEFD